MTARGAAARSKLRAALHAYLQKTLMFKSRKVWLVLFVVVSALGMWARYAYQQAERRRMERTLDELARFEREQTLHPQALASATPDDAFEETRDAFQSELPRESLEAIRQAVGGEFKLMQLTFAGEFTQAVVSTDGQSAQAFMLYRGRKKVEGPSPVRVIGDNPLTDSLFDLKDADLSLIPRLAKEAVERAGIEGAKVTSASLSYPVIRYKGESPEWTFFVERGSPPDWEHKDITFDAKGKFKRIS